MPAFEAVFFERKLSLPNYAISANEQIFHMTQNGVSFQLFPPQEAEDFLTNKNFFFKVKAFDKNFEKYNNKNNPHFGQYINLDFAYLVDLSRKDAILRELILDLALDLEHYLKVAVNRFLMNNKIEVDSLIVDFAAHSKTKSLTRIEEKYDLAKTELEASTILSLINNLQSSCSDTEKLSFTVNTISSLFNHAYIMSNGIDCNHIERSFEHLGASFYSRKLVEKYGYLNKMEPWHFMEMASFGDFISFYKFLFFDSNISASFKDRQSTTIDVANAHKIKNLLFPAKTLRNAAAHNDCLLNTLNNRLKSPIVQIRRFLEKQLTLDKALIAYSWKTAVVHDYAALLICYDCIVPPSKTKNKAAKKLRDMHDALLQNIIFYQQHTNIRQPLRLLADSCNGFAERWTQQ